MAAAEHLSTTRLEEVRSHAAALVHDEPTRRDRVDRAIDLMWTAARTDPDLRTTLRGEERRQRAAVAAVADEVGGPEIAGAPRYADPIELLFTSMRGAALVYALEDRPATTDPHLALWKRVAARSWPSTVGLTAAVGAGGSQRCPARGAITASRPLRPTP